MMTLDEALKDPTRKAKVVGDAVALLDSEVEKKRGLSGLALKAGYAMVKALKPGFMGEIVALLIDEAAPRLQPILDEATRAGSGVAEYLGSAPQKERVAEALLQATDERAAKSPHAALKATYERLRGSAKGHVEEAVPGLGGVIARLVG